MSDHNHNHISWTLLLEYIKGEADADSRAIVEQWLAGDPERREILSQVEQIWNSPAERKQEWDTEASWRRFEERYGSVEDQALPVRSPRNVSALNAERRYLYRGARFAYSIAAGFIIMLVVVFVAMNQQAASQEITLQEIITKKGERTSLRLSDGSRVVLNAGSRLQIPSDYGQTSRTLYLEGEALFEVEHDEEKPFLVYTGDVYTEDLGTKFNIRTYDARSEGIGISVVVSEGLVELGGTNGKQLDSTVITPHQMGTVGEDGKVEITEVDDLGPYLGWASGRLVFKDRPFGEVREELERWYDIDITVTDPALNDLRLSATFEGDPLGEVLNLVALSLEMDVKREKKKVVFSPFKRQSTNIN